MNKAKSYYFAIAAISLWATVATASKISLRYLYFHELLLYASATSTIILCSLLLCQGRFRCIFFQRKKDYGNSFFLGVLNPFFYYLILFKAYSILPAQEAITLNYTWPLMLTILSVPLLHQRLSVKHIFALCTSFAGVLIITHTNANEVGVFKNRLLPLGSALIWALFWIINIRDTRESLLKLCTNFLFGLIPISIYCIVVNQWSSLSIPAIGAAMYVGCFEMGITFVLWLKALECATNTASISNLVYLTPFLSLMIVRIILKETILLSTILGLVFIILGILLQHVPKNGISSSRTSKTSR